MKLARPAIGMIVSILLQALAAGPSLSRDHGAMIKFSSTPNIDTIVTRSSLQKQAQVLYASPASGVIHRPFDRILFNGTFADTNIAVQVSVQLPDGRWGHWRDAYLKCFPNGRFWARVDVERTEAQRLRYRLVDRGISTPARLEIYAVEVMDAAAKDESKAPVRLPDRVEYALQDSIPKPPVVSREQWGANPPIGPLIPHSPYRFAQHHTAGRRVQTLEEGMAEQRFIQDFHQNGRGWQDIGYHFSVDDAGRIYEGVNPDYRGTHAGGNNTGNVGIDLFGNYEISGEFPTDEALDALVWIWSWLAYTYGVNSDSLYGHRDYNATACPGSNFYVEIPGMRAGIKKSLGFGAPYAVDPLPQPFSTEVSPSTPISLIIRDDEEGVDQYSIGMWVNGELATPEITGAALEYTLAYQPPEPFPSSQNVQVRVIAADLQPEPNVMEYSFRFAIKVAALHAEVTGATTMRNADLQLEGDWTAEDSDVSLPDLTNGQRLMATDTDGSHRARVFPVIQQSGDYRVRMANSNTFLGESASYRFTDSAGRSHPIFVEYNSVYRGQWSNLSPTPVFFATGTPSSGFVELAGLDGLPTRLVLDALRFEKVDRMDAPHAPVLKWTRRPAGLGNQIEVAWYPSLEGDVRGYRLFMSEDGMNWDDPLVDEETLGPDADRHLVEYTGDSTTVYFRLVTVDSTMTGSEGEEEPLLSPPTDTYGVGFGFVGNPRVLVVDNFDRLASWRQAYHPFVRNHGEALAANGVAFDACTETAVQSGEIDLSDYEAVVYFCGDDSRDDESLAAADQWRLLEYLEAGGKLFISGSEIGYDFDDTTPTELQRYQNMLKARYAGDRARSNAVKGEAGTVFEGLQFTYGTAQGPDTYIEDYPDYLQAFGGSSVALRYGDNQIAGVAYTGAYGQSSQTAQMIYLGFTFETIMDPTQRAAMMNRALRYFGILSGVADAPTNQPDRYELAQSHPNPFSPAGSGAGTNIRFALPRTEEVQLAVFNLLGQRIATLVDRQMPAGSHRASWDGRTDDGTTAAPGLYIYRLETGATRLHRKLLLVR